jgi:hypothetical protein
MGTAMLKKFLAVAALVLAPALVFAGDLSEETKSCLSCHRGITPGIVGDWETSRHSRTSPAEAMQKPELERRMSAKEVDGRFLDKAVGCYECHGQNTDKHKDNFNHYGYSINVVVSPNDCRTCHPVEVRQYAGSKKANAVGNLSNNPVYHTLVKTIIGKKDAEGTTITQADPSAYTRQETCYACHGTEIKVRGMKTVKSRLGPVQVPDLENWPNQGVGRLNPDGSMGACTPCHARHAFSIRVAREPHTCSQCHLEPDVPAWNVYSESKHGNIYHSLEREWDFDAVPWKLGKDFTTPTCAACHNSLLVSAGGEVIAQRTHDFGARLWVRLFGLIYSHAQPKEGDTSIIRNADGLPLPTTFLGEPASEYLIGPEEQAKRKGLMQGVCKGCHSTSWVEAHFAKLDNTIEETDHMILQATKLMTYAWENGLADNSNPFDEALEQKWVKQWLFYANTTKYASAMTGAQDYTTFKYGWWGMTTNLQEMRDKIDLKLKAMKALEEYGDEEDEEGENE